MTSSRFHFYSPLPMVVQLTIGNLMVALPLTLAIAYAFVQLDSQTQRQQTLIHNANNVGRISYAIEDQLAEVERTSRQYTILNDERLLKLLIQKVASLKASYHNLEALLPSNLSLNINPVVIPLIDQVLWVAENESDKDKLFAISTNLFQEIKLTSKPIIQSSQLWVDDQIDLIRVDFKQTENALFALLVVAVVLTIIVLTFVSYATARPIRQLSEAIHSLGQHNLQNPIAIKGAKDFIELGERLEWLRVQLGALEDQKKLFMQHVTHELKTPLSSIKEATELLQEEIPGPITTDQAAVLSLLEKNIGYLNGQINQLLNFNTISKRFAMNSNTVELKTFFNTQVAVLEDLSQAKQIRWILSGDTVAIQTDLRCLSMAVVNILTNAIKFSPHHSDISIYWSIVGASASKSDEGNLDETAKPITAEKLPSVVNGTLPLQIDIIDQGPGIPEHEKSKVVELFYQGEHKVKGAVKGSGIGLAIVKECIMSMHGEFEIKDAKGGGTHIRIVLPVTPATAPEKELNDKQLLLENE